MFSLQIADFIYIFRVYYSNKYKRKMRNSYTDKLFIHWVNYN
jgi:hypothetical protein